MVDDTVAALRRKREELIAEHVEAENRHDAHATLATMHRAHYELPDWGLEIDGEEPVRQFLEAFFAGMPDIRSGAERFHHADDAVIVEVRTVGINGNSFNRLSVGVFEFDGDKMLGEKVIGAGDAPFEQPG
jgi:hypothetical protein